MALFPARATTLAFLSALCCPKALALQVHRAVAVESPASSQPPLEVDLEDSLLADCHAHANPVSGALLEEESGHRFKIHVHLHKAGGSLMCNLAHVAGEKAPKWDWKEGANCNWMHHDDLGDSGIPKLFPSCETRRHEYKKHNWTYTQIEREITDSDLECDGFSYSCLIREPLDLITSNINYEESGYWGPGNTTGQNATVRIGHMRQLISKGLSEAARDHWDTDAGLNPTLGWKFMDNMQTRLLGGAIRVPPGQVTREHLETAKRRLAKFHVVAKLEDMDDPVKRNHIFAKMGWNITLEERQCNSAERTDPLPHADKVWLRELNKWDYELYRWLDA